jgi:hypothetical protein
MEKVQLLEILAERESDVKAYQDLLLHTQQLLEHAKNQVSDLRAELSNSMPIANSKYTTGELSGVRRGIVEVLGYNKLMSPRQIVEFMPGHSIDLIERELRKLARNQRSDIKWNGERGIKSRYARIAR